MSLARKSVAGILIGSLVALTGSGCQNMNSTQKGAIVGGAGGAGLGAIIGKQLGSTGAGAAIGALAGTGAGALIGNAKDESDQKEAYARQVNYERNQRVREQRAMTNRDVIDMSGSQISDHRIIATIKDRGGNFDTSPQGIIYLSKYGVSDEVIGAMQANNSH